MDPDKVTFFAQTDYRNKRQKFGIKSEDRSRHVYVIGKTGMGKSTLLENMAAQDIMNGEGVAFIDPHGSAAETLLDYVPKDRIKDVLYFAPHDLGHPISFNVMEDVDPDKRHLVVAGLMSTFEKIWVDAWSARMAYILQNTLLALLEYPDATLLGVNRMYIDTAFRKKVVEHVTDPAVKSFWTEEFAKYTDRFAAEATPAIQNKVGQFVSNPMIRNIISQPKSSFDLRKIIDEKKIFIVNLSKGQVGESNAELLGSMIVTKLYLAALSRADVSSKELAQLPHFYLFVDEFQSFANKSFADILSEARKYKFNLHLAHQYIEQMSEEVRAGVFGNIGTMITFRIGAFDAEIFEKEYAPTFTAEDLVNLGKYQIYLKLMVDGIASAPFSATTLPPVESKEASNKVAVVEHSRDVYTKPREDVETAIKQWHEAATLAGIEDHKKRSQGSTSEFNLNSSSKPKSKFEHRVNNERKGNSKEAELRKAISLDHFKKDSNKKKKKGPSEKNIAELREALTHALGSDAVLSIRGEKKNEKAGIKNNDTNQSESEKISKLKRVENPMEESNNNAKSPKEVPENVIKKMLDLENRES